MHQFVQHVFQAQGLRSKLNVVTGGNVGGLVAATVLVFHRVGHATGQKLDHIGLAHQAKYVVPQWHGPLHAHAFGGFHPRLVHLGVYRLAAQGVPVLVKHLLQMNQAALSRAVAPVLQGGQGDGVGVGSHGGRLD